MKNKIKIIHVISDSNIGGAGRYLLTYLKNADINLFNPILVVPKGASLTALAEKLGVKVYEADGLAEKSFSPVAVSDLQKIIKSEMPQIVHAHGCLSARIAAKLVDKNIKAVYTRHSVFPQKLYLKKGVGKWLNTKVSEKYSDEIIAVAQAAKNNLVETGIDPKKVTVIYNGVDPLNQRKYEECEALRIKYGVENSFTVGILARLTEVKGHKYLIDAFKILKNKDANIKLIIAGTGEAEEELKSQIKAYKLENNVIMAGFVTDVEGLVNILDVQANASYGTEAASLALMEGMSLGKPTVASDFGGNPELINEKNGIVVPQKDAESLADAIYKLYKDKNLYNAMSDGAKMAYESRFTAKIMTENMENFYKKLLK